MAGLAIQLLGSFRVALDGKPVTRFESDKVRALLAYLTVEADRPHRREMLAGLLWPDWPERSARASLSQALYNLRAAIGDREAEPSFLLITPQTLQFNRESDHSLDVARLSGSPPEATAAQLQEAVAAYRGPFLAGFSLPDSALFEEWVITTREQLRRLALEAVSKLAGYHETRAEFAQALTYARRGVSLDPTWEAGHRSVMRLLALGGERSAALAHYETCRQLLDAELGLEPSEETQALFELLVGGDQPAPLTAAPPVPDRPPRAVGPCPYRGLAAFREEDAPFFFGRQSFVARLLGAVRHHALVAVIVGSSGSGKSSVVYAGLIPQLREEESSYWRIVDCRPGSQPFHSLAAALVPLLEPDLWETDRMIETRKLGEALHDGRLSLHQVVERALNKAPQGSHLLLVLDQFEELYTLCPDPAVRNAYLDQLLGAVAAWRDRSESPFTLLLTLRADFMGQALAHRPFADVLQESSVMMGPMTPDELRAAIEEPAGAQGAAFEEGLVERILDDVGQEPGTLPLLEFALTLLWEGHRFGWLTHDAYDEVGRVEGSLARHADQVYAGLDPAQQIQARRLLVQLVRPGEGTEDTRRVATRAELGEGNWGLAQHLADRRLVVTGRAASTGDETAEVVHEALIQKWGQMRGWMDQDRAFRTWQERLRAALQAWEATERDEGALPRGAPLAEAEGWLAERGAELSDLEKEYIGAGVALRERRTAEREAQRQRELEAAQQLAEERARSAARLRRRAVWLGLALVLALIAAGVAGVFVDRNATLADREAAQRVTAQAANTVAVGERAAALTAGAQEAAQRTVAETSEAQEAAQRAVAEAEAVARATAEAIAVEERVVAESAAGARATAEAVAVEEREEARRQASVGLAAQALTELEGASPERAVLLALEALENYPYTGQAESALAQAVEEFKPYIDLPSTEVRFANAVWSPGGERIVGVGGEGVGIIWDSQTGQVLLRFNERDYSGELGVAWSPQGDRIVTAAGDLGVARVWDAGTGALLLTYEGHEGAVYHVDLSQDGRYALTAGADGTARAWEAETGVERLVLAGHAGGARDAAWSPEGDRILSAGMDGVLRMWDAQTGEGLLALTAHAGGALSLAWSPDGTRVATGGVDGVGRVWDASTGQALVSLIGHDEEVRDVNWSPGGRWIATAGADGTVRVWDALDGGELFSLRGRTGDLWTIEWSPDGERLVTGGGMVSRVWDLREQAIRLVGHTDALADAQWSPDMALIATSGSDATVRVWDAATGELLLTFTGHQTDERTEQYTSFFSWSPSGDLLATIGSDGVVRVWDPRTGEEHLVLSSQETPLVWTTDWSPDGSRFLTECDDSTIRVWDAETGEQILVFGNDCQWLDSPTWSPDGTRIATGCALGTLEGAFVWDAATGEPLVHLDNHTDWINAAEWSPDGRRILTGSFDRTLRIWDAETGEELLVFPGHTDGIWDAAWSPDGRRVASADESGMVIIWDSETGVQVQRFEVDGAVTGIEWSPDGTHVIVAGRFPVPEIRRAWQSTEELLAYARECCVVRELTPEEREQFGLPPAQ